MENLSLFNWNLFEDGQPTAFMWAILTLAAAVIFTIIGVLIWRLGRGNRNKKHAVVENAAVDNTPTEPVTTVVDASTFEKREDNNQLEYYDPLKAQREAEQIQEQQRLEAEKRQKEEERLQSLMEEEERKRRDLEEKERAFDEKRQRQEEARLERERREAERLAEKERARAEKEAAKAAKRNRNKNVDDFFATDEDDDAVAFNFDQQSDTNDNDDTINFWNQASNDDRGEEKSASVIMPAAPATDPRLEKVLSELENQKQAEQERFANLMSELEKQKQETARLQGELQAKEKSENLIAQAKKEMEQMIKDSQDQINNLEKQEKAEKKGKEDRDLLQEIKSVLAAEREAQEQRLREQENSLAAVLNAMENERRAKEENALNAEREAQKEDEFVKMQNQYQNAILQMQEKFQNMLNEANAQKVANPVTARDYEIQNAYQAQLERERAETATLIEQMQQEVDKMSAEREAERREYAEKQRALDAAMAEALQTQRNEFEQAQQRVVETNMANVEKILQDIEKQRAHEQDMFNNILNELAAEREDNNQVKAAFEQMVRESEARIAKLENQALPRGLDEESMEALKNVLAVEREEQLKRMEEYRNEIANLCEMIAAEHAQRKSNNSDDDSNQLAMESLRNVLATEREEQAKRMEEYRNEIDKLRATIETEREKQKKTNHDDSGEGNQVAYVAKDTEDNEKLNARFAAMQNEIQQLNALREAESAESEKRHAELLEALNRTVIAGENAKAEAQQIERENQLNRVNETDEIMNARIESMQNEIQHLNELREAERAESEKRHAELLEALNHTIVTGENAKSAETQQAERESVDRILNDLQQQNRLEQDRFADIMNELVESREDTKKAQAAMQQLIQESTELINQLNNKQEIRGVDEETMSALKDLLAHEREMQEKRLAEHEEKLNLAVSTIEEQKQNVAEEQTKQAEYEQMIADMRGQYEAELASLRETIANQNASNQTQSKVNNDDDDNAGNEIAQDNDSVNEAVLAQLASLQENIAALEDARNAEKAEFEQRYDELNKVLGDSLKVQRLEMELAKEREINELKMQQALQAQRNEIEAEKEQELQAQRNEIEAEKQALAEQRAELQPDTNEATQAIVASFKEEMSRQYEEFVKLLNDKKAEAENAQKEYDEIIESASEADKAALKEEQYDVREMMEQLREERKAAREEAQALREELEAQRIETEAKLMKQLSEVKEGLVSELSSELDIKEKFNAMEQEVEAQSQEKLQQNEAEEARIKQEYEEFKQRIADEVVALEEKNAALQAELEKARAEKSSDDESKQAEYEENEKRLREKYMQLRNELMKEAEQVNKQSEEIAAEKQVIEDKKKDLEEEKERLQNEVELLKQQVLEIKSQPQDSNNQGGTITEEQLAEIRASLEAEYQQREKEMLSKLEEEKQSLVAREAELKSKEENIAQEELRIREQSKAVTTMITNREYTKEERERLVLDYSMKLQDLEERLRQNEKALRENNREFIPLRRIKNTLDRDLRLLRKREAIVAKQEVLVYGVNNISTVEPERIKKLEQDIKQLTGLQQSVANCETILNKNKDRYPTLENLDRVLRAQNEQIRRDLEEVKSAMAMFGEDAATGAAQA